MYVSPHQTLPPNYAADDAGRLDLLKRYALSPYMETVEETASGWVRAMSADA